MARWVSFAVLVSFLSFQAAAQAGSGKAAPSPLLASIDRQVSFEETDLSAEYTIETRSPGGGASTMVAAMFRRDRTGQFLVLIIEPTVDKGKGYLRLDDNLWLYDPVNRAFTFTSAKERFEKSGLRNSDFGKSTLAADYDVVAERREKLGKFDCRVLDLKANNDRVSFPQKRVWVTDDMLVRKAEDSSLSGQLMRTTAIPSYQKIGEKSVPLQIVIVDHLKSKAVNGKVEYEQTKVTVAKPSLQKLADSVYSKAYLEKVNK